MQHKYIHLQNYPNSAKFFMYPNNRNIYTMLKFNEEEQKSIVIPNKDAECLIPLGHEFMVIKRHVIMLDRVSIEELQHSIDVIMADRHTYPCAIFDNEQLCYEWIRKHEVRDCLNMIEYYSDRANFACSEEYTMSQPWKGQLESYIPSKKDLMVGK